MPKLRSAPIGTRPRSAEVRGQVAGAARQVDHDRARAAVPARADGPAAPPDVHAEGHDAVDQVVAGGDHVEHRLHRAGLVGTGRAAARRLAGSVSGVVGGGHRRPAYEWRTRSPSRTGSASAAAAYTPTMTEHATTTAADARRRRSVPAPIRDRRVGAGRPARAPRPHPAARRRDGRRTGPRASRSPTPRSCATTWSSTYDWRRLEAALNGFGPAARRSTASASTSCTTARRTRTRCRWC